MSKKNLSFSEMIGIYNNIRTESINEESLPKEVDSLSKPAMMKKMAMMTKFSEKLLRKMDEEDMKAVYKLFMKVGRARVIKDLGGKHDGE